VHGKADLFAATRRCVAETSSFHETVVIVLQKHYSFRSSLGLRLRRPAGSQGMFFSAFMSSYP
jgi:hypothetical protein